MPTNKLASYRYRVLNSCFRRRLYWTIEELQEEVSQKLNEDFGMGNGVSRRTIESDISLMRSLPPRGFDAPIMIKRGTGQYYYKDRQFSIDQNPISSDDLKSIREATVLLRQFKGLPHFAELGALLFKVEGELGFHDVSSANIQFEYNDLLKGTEWINSLFQAMKNRQTLNVSYQPFHAAEPNTFTYHPYLLKEYQSRWFAFGYNESVQEISNLALDRIKNITSSITPYIPNTFFDPDTYFADMIGVSRNSNSTPEQIILQATKSMEGYLDTKPIHHSQKKRISSETKAIYELFLIPNYELIATILRFGGDLKVIEPNFLKEDIRRRVAQLLEEK